MYSAHDLEDFGKIASSNLLDKSVSLNEGIQKIAGENSLNRQQINRVVEAANVETYISMMKTAEGKYIMRPWPANDRMIRTDPDATDPLNQWSRLPIVN